MICRNFLSYSLSLPLFVSHDLQADIWFVSAERFQTTAAGRGSGISARQCFPSMIYSQVNESMKRLSVTEGIWELYGPAAVMLARCLWRMRDLPRRLHPQDCCTICGLYRVHMGLLFMGLRRRYSGCLTGCWMTECAFKVLETKDTGKL